MIQDVDAGSLCAWFTIYRGLSAQISVIGCPPRVGFKEVLKNACEWGSIKGAGGDWWWEQ